jgi:tetratricopeptide (TPR) repeat protein
VHAAQALSVIADSLRFSGDPEGALNAIEEARGHAESLSPPTHGNSAALFNVLWRQGVILGEDGQINLNRPDEAIVVLQEAFDIIEGLANQDPNDASSRVLFKSSGRELGDILRWRDPERALAVYDRALSRLGEIKNKNQQSRLGEAELMASSSYALRRLHRDAEANRRIDAALALVRELKTYPAEAVTPGDETATVLHARADHLADTGQFQGAADVYQELLDKVLASHPGHSASPPESARRGSSAHGPASRALAIVGRQAPRQYIRPPPARSRDKALTEKD